MIRTNRPYQKRARQGGVLAEPRPDIDKYKRMSIAEGHVELHHLEEMRARIKNRTEKLSWQLKCRQKKLFAATTYTEPLTREMLAAGHALRDEIFPTIEPVEDSLNEEKKRMVFLGACITCLEDVLLAKHKERQELLDVYPWVRRPALAV